MNLVDSSGWIEYLEGGPERAAFWKPLHRGEEAATEVFDLLALGRILPLDETLATAAARVSVTHRLAMANSLIYAAARAHQATLWTMDRHFEGLPGVEYRPRRP